MIKVPSDKCPNSPVWHQTPYELPVIGGHQTYICQSRAGATYQGNWMVFNYSSPSGGSFVLGPDGRWFPIWKDTKGETAFATAADCERWLMSLEVTKEYQDYQAALAEELAMEDA